MTRSVLYRIVSSWWLTAFIGTVLSAVYAFFSLGEDAFEQWRSFIFHSIPGISLYLLLTANLLVISIRIIHSALSYPVPDPAAVKRMDAHVSVDAGAGTLDRISRWMVSKKFKPLSVKDGLYAVRGRLSFIPGLILRSGIVMIMVSAVFSIHLRKTGEARLREGGHADVLGMEISVEHIRSGLPDEFLQVGERNMFRINSLSAQILVSGSRKSVSNGFPVRVNGRYLRLIHTGFFQPFTFGAQGRRLQEDAYLDILPPGRTHIVSLPDGEFLLTFRLKPAKTIKKGLLSGKLYNLRKPVYTIVVQKGKSKNVSEIISASPGETVEGKGYTLSLGKQGTFVTLEAVEDPALFWLYAGTIVTIVGILLMPLRFFWYRREMVATREDDAIHIGYREEFYRKWGIQKFYRWSEDILPPE